MKDLLIKKAIEDETKRQKEHIELIASENFVSEDVLEAQGSVLTNKYAEGYPGRRYYDGTEFIDVVESAAIERLKKLFGVKFANVQPHSGSSANQAAISALVKPGGKIMGLSLDSGGHLTHGYKISFSGIFYNSESYEVNEEGFLDYEDILKKAKEFKPDLIIAGYSAYPRVIDWKKFRKIADKVGAKLMADIAHIAGLIVAGEHPSPVKYADVITSTTHKTLRGARGGIIMTNDEEVAKAVNRSIFPGFQGGPLAHIIAAKAITFNEALQPEFRKYIKQVVKNSKAFANEFIKMKVPVITGGTDNHLFTINVKKGYGITGHEASTRLQKNNITVNKNTIPRDTESPLVSSGIRLGTAAMTTKGYKENDFIKVAQLIDRVLRSNEDVTKEVKELNKI